MSRKRSEASKNRSKLRQQKLRENDEVNAKRRLKRLYLKALKDEDKPTVPYVKDICFYLINSAGEILGRIAMTEDGILWLNTKAHPTLKGDLKCHYVVKDNWQQIGDNSKLNELLRITNCVIKPFTGEK